MNPDPAFGMFPIEDKETDQIIKENDLTRFFDKDVIMFTTAEPAPISRHSFEGKFGVSKEKCIENS